jgi:hypothetical protein
MGAPSPKRTLPWFWVAMSRITLSPARMGWGFNRRGNSVDYRRHIGVKDNGE